MPETQETNFNILNVLYRNSNITPLTYTGDWVDVRVSAVTDMHVNATEGKLLEMTTAVQSGTGKVTIAKGASVKIWHGFCLELPTNHEAILCPRGSLFKNTGLVFTCSGVIDEGYKGNNDEWFSTFLATREVTINIDDRICQFRIQEKQPKLVFKPVESMNAEDRGGHGSTGGYTTK